MTALIFKDFNSYMVEIFSSWLAVKTNIYDTCKDANKFQPCILQIKINIVFEIKIRVFWTQQTLWIVEV